MYEPSKMFTLPQCDPVVEMEPWRKALLDAAEYIRVHGHCRGSLEDDSGAVCVVGALHKTRSRGVAMIEAASKLSRHTGGGAIDVWSDATPTDQVLRTLTECAQS